MTTDEQGQVLSKSVYDPLGNKWSETGDESTDTGERQFTNQVYDGETGLYYFNMRYYDPQLGMFISPDPAMSGSNHYVYANGNPVHFVDLSGLSWDCPAPPCDGPDTPPITITIGGGSGGDSGSGGGDDDGGGSGDSGGGSGSVSFDLSSDEDKADYTAARSANDAMSLSSMEYEYGMSNVERMIRNGDIVPIFIFPMPSASAVSMAVAPYAQKVAAGIGAASTWLATQWDNLKITAAQIWQSIMPQATKVLRFGANDLVYGPSARGALRNLQQTSGGRLLTDLAKPPGVSWSQFSINTMRQHLSAGGKLHFDLTNMKDLNGVLSGVGQYANSVTAQELRWIQANWSSFSNSIFFYSNGVQVGAPW